MRKILKKEEELAKMWACNLIGTKEVARKYKVTHPAQYSILARALKKIHYENK